MIENCNYRWLNLLVAMYMIVWILSTTKAYSETLVFEIAVEFLFPIED